MISAIADEDCFANGPSTKFIGNLWQGPIDEIHRKSLAMAHRQNSSEISGKGPADNPSTTFGRVMEGEIPPLLFFVVFIYIYRRESCSSFPSFTESYSSSLSTSMKPTTSGLLAGVLPKPVASTAISMRIPTSLMMNSRLCLLKSR
jgi:hypothetical protein